MTYEKCLECILRYSMLRNASTKAVAHGMLPLKVAPLFEMLPEGNTADRDLASPQTLQ